MIVIGLHGYDGGSTLGPLSLAALTNALKAAGHETIVPTLTTDNVVNAGRIRDLVTAAGGRAPVWLVGHSMGGLAGREYLKHLDGADKIAGYIAIDSPHFGTWKAARLWSWVPQIWPTSTFITALNEPDETPGSLPYVQLTVEYTQPLPGAFTRHIDGVDHRSVVKDPATLALITRILAGDMSALVPPSG